MPITKRRAIQLISAHLTGDLREKDFMDGWPSNAYVASNEPVWSIRIASNESRTGGDLFITISKLTGDILADRMYGE